MTRTVQQLFKELDRDAVLAQLYAAYPDAARSAAGYELAWQTISELTPFSGDLKFVVVALVAHAGEEPYFNVSGRETRAGESFSISLMPWDEWLSLELLIEDTTLTEDQVLAHLLWEMTWYGYEQENISELRNDLKAQAALIDSLPKNPTDEELAAAGLIKFESVEQLMASLDEEDDA